MRGEIRSRIRSRIRRGKRARGRGGRIKIRIKIRIMGFVECGEVGGAEVADFMAEAEVDADEFVAVDPGEVAFGDGGFDVGLDFGQAGQVFLARVQGLFVEGFEVDGAEGADVRGELAVPVDEGALGDMDVGGDAREAEALGAHFEELVFSVVAIHGTSFRMVGAKGQTLRWLYWLYWLFLYREGRCSGGAAVQGPRSTVHSPQSTVRSPQGVGRLLSLLRAHCDHKPRRSGVSIPPGRGRRPLRGMAALCSRFGIGTTGRRVNGKLAGGLAGTPPIGRP
jgi:hypothetical protein